MLMLLHIQGDLTKEEAKARFTSTLLKAAPQFNEFIAAKREERIQEEKHRLEEEERKREEEATKAVKEVGDKKRHNGHDSDLPIFTS